MDSYTSTVSHEMRTPLGTSLFFLQQIISMLAEVPQEHISPTVDHYMKLIIGQLNFMQSFVDDLLDLRMLREGAFQLTMASFNPKSIVELCYRIFKPQATARNLAFNYQICERLAPPSAP